MKPAATALSKICFLKPGVEEKREKQQLRPRQTRDFSVGLATAGALFVRLKTFNIRAGDTYKTRARRVCALSVEKRCKTPPNVALCIQRGKLTTAAFVVREDLQLCISFIAHIANKGHVIRVIRGEDIDIGFNILS